MPAFDPFTFHWYEGVRPPFTGVAVYVVIVPEQTVVPGVDIDTLTGRIGLTVMVTEFEVAGFPPQNGTLDVRMHEMTSPFPGVMVKDELFVPALMLFTFH